VAAGRGKGPTMAQRVLIAGATGFVGRVLARRLLDDGYRVRCLVREPDSQAARALERAGCELAVADLTEAAGLDDAVADVDAAYFLVHMIDSGEDYADAERAGAARFAKAASAAGVKRVIYLGGLGDETASEHLTARHGTALALRELGPPLTYFRAAMIIGPGSESYELLRAIVERLPAMPVTDWLHTRTQPIGAEDVVDYLREALDVEESAGREIQIGGPQVVTHLQLVNEMAAALGRRPPLRIGMSAEIARPKTVAAGAGAVTSGTPEIASQISMGLTTPTVVDDPSGMALFDIRPKRLDAALAAAIDTPAKPAVTS
jgi:uncharacterized protein YbjT (DUF2867 family)